MIVSDIVRSLTVQVMAFVCTNTCRFQRFAVNM